MRGARAERCPARAAWLLGGLLTAVAYPSRAQVVFPSVEDRALGVRMADVSRVLDAHAARRHVEAGDVALFGIAGLRVSGVRATAEIGGLPARLEAAQVSSPVGSHMRVAGESGYAIDGRWLGLLRAGVELVAVPGYASSRAIVAGAVSCIGLGRVAVLADVDARSGERGVETATRIMVAARAADRVTLVAGAGIHGARGLASHAGVVAAPHAMVRLVAGYDDGSESVNLAVALTVSGWAVAVGMFEHAVLGASRGVTVGRAW